jgi:hypothetical protein
MWIRPCNLSYIGCCVTPSYKILYFALDFGYRIRSAIFVNIASSYQQHIIYSAVINDLCDKKLVYFRNGYRYIH